MRLIPAFFALAIALSFAAAAGAEDLTERWNAEYHYGLAYPSDWKPDTVGKFMDQDAFSVMNTAKDININVMAKRFSPQNRGLYRSITDIPNGKEGLSAVIRNELSGRLIQTGVTQLSNEPALWFTYSFVHRSLGQEVWFVALQLSSLRNDIVYTITAKVAGASREDATSKYNKYLPTITRTIATFTFAS